MTYPLGKIITLFMSEEKTKKRLETETLSLDKKGILGDKYYNKDIQRSILITSSNSYLLAKEKHIMMPYGSLGENILIDYNPYQLSSGTHLHIGEVILEINQNCTICEHLAHIDKRLPKLLEYDRGIFAKVIRNGTIKKHDLIFIKKK